jgi:hypothetical protein
MNYVTVIYAVWLYICCKMSSVNWFDCTSKYIIYYTEGAGSAPMDDLLVDDGIWFFLSLGWI